MQTLTAIMNILLNTAGVTDLVGQDIHPNYIPELQKKRSFPMLVVNAEDATVQNTMSGPSALANQTVKVSCIARDYESMVNVGLALMNALLKKKGTYAGLTVRGIYYRGENEDESAIPELGEQDLFHIKELEFLVWYYIPSLIGA